jgi:hypothetical protein
MAKDKSKPDPNPESDKGSELDQVERRSGDNQSQAGQKRGGGGESRRRSGSDSAKVGIDGQHRGTRNREGPESI